ncbi:unnamed protein product [Brachionus calyciflorus]|uniref:Uncharacterized protein n=1 Tax=Brachionus calyciflorus TaxID=104777 RepID=A0A813MNZ5_9BILA|nr:unnamed protein product [Brachionus calyciflorus]
MGNSSSNKLEKNKIEFDDDQSKPEIYSIIDKNGNGELVELAILAQRTRDFSRVDEYIRTNCSKYILNDGKGENLPFAELAKYRFKDKKLPICKKGKFDKFFRKPCIPNFSIIKASDNEYLTKYVCFDLANRGNNGETLLHLCFLNGSVIHMLIAKRLIKFYPNLIKDICIGDEHFGESVLHMAIVNEDPHMVNILISNGADIHQRCSGIFFIPDDQKENRQDILCREFPQLPIETNYHGYSYFGEYPLSFAAVLNQEECVRILIANGADPNRQDSNGNTVLHMLVINNNLEMFKLLVDLKADLHIKNRQGYTPLTLAAQLCRQEIFIFILEAIREVYWVYADISCAAYPLKNVDTISQDGSIDSKSVLYLILEKNTEEHLELLEGFLTNLLHKKWVTFVKYRFYLEVVIFALFFIINAVAIFLKRDYYNHLTLENCTIDDEGNRLKPNCSCAYLNPIDDLHYPRTIIEIIVVLYTIVFLLITFNDFYINGWKLFLRTLIRNPTRIIFLISLFCIIAIIPFRISCNTAVEDILIALEVILLSFSSLYYARGFRLVCNFVYNLHRIIGFDLVRFFIIYFIFLIGFSQTFYLILLFCNPESEQRVFDTPLQAILDTFILTLGEVTVDYEQLPFMSSYSIIGEIFCVLYMLLGTLLLVNILIAMMDHTQEITNDRPLEWLRQWGRQVLAVEQNINTKERLKQQQKYTNHLKSGEKALIVQWQQKFEEREESKSKKEIFQGFILESDHKYD